MAFSWYLYSRLSLREAKAVDQRLKTAIDGLLDSRPGLVRKGQRWGETGVEGGVPSADDVAELAEAYDRVVSDEVLDRLDQCHSAFHIDRVGVNDLDPLQVSILRWLIAQVGPCVIDWGDQNVVLSEDVLTEVDDYPDAGDLATPTPAPAPTRGTGSNTPSDVARAEATVAALETVHEDPFLDRRLMKLLDSYPEWVKHYVKLLDEEGAVSDAVAAAELGVPPEQMAKSLDELRAATTKLAKEANE